MVHEYHYTKIDEELIYISIITLNNSYETSLYIGKQLVRRKSFHRGLHVIQKDNINLRIRIKLFKTIPEMRIDGKEVSLRKIKRKELRKLLDEANIYNEINPQKKAAKPFKARKLFVPALFIIPGIIGTIYAPGMGKVMKFFFLFLLVIGGFLLFSPLLLS